MDPDVQKKADTRFAETLERTGARDPREFYRTMLRELKSSDPEAYEDAVGTYERDVLRPIAAGEVEPLEAWLEFGRALAQKLHPGRTVVIDETGKAGALDPPARWDRLTLHLPDDRRTRPIPVALPPSLAPAQRAAVDLLALGKLRLPDA